MRVFMIVMMIIAMAIMMVVMLCYMFMRVELLVLVIQPLARAWIV